MLSGCMTMLSVLVREWLHIDDKGTLFCNICVQLGKPNEKNAFVQGCTSHKKDSITCHESSRYHQNAVKTKQVKELSLGDSPAERVITTLHAKDEEKLINLFINCHGQAIQGRPYTDFWLLMMDKKKKVNVGDTYATDKKAREFTKAIVQIEREKVTDHNTSAKFSAVLADGSSDVSVIENEIVYVRVCHNGNPRTMFVYSAQVARGQATNIMDAIERSITENLMAKWDFTKTLVALGSDGASVMHGTERGVAALLRKDAPGLVAVHCYGYGHRLELAFKDVIEKVPLLERLNVLLYGLFYFNHRSPLNRAN